MSEAVGRVGTVTPADLLAFEARWPRHTPAKDAAIRQELGITPVRYVVLLRRAAETNEGMNADALTARRVRDVAARRAHERARRVQRVA